MSLDLGMSGEYLWLAPDAVVMAGPGGEIRYVNERALELFGYTEDELLGADIEMLIPRNLRDQHQRHRERYREEPTRRPMGAEITNLVGLRKDDTEIAIEISLSPVTLVDEVIVMAVVRDITRRLVLEEERLLALQSLDVVDDAVVVIDDASLRVEYANRTASVRFHLSPPELSADMTLLDFLPEITVDVFAEMAEPLRQGQTPTVVFETELRGAVNETTPVEVSLQLPSELSQGNRRRFVAVIRDNTDRIETRRLLEESEAAFRSAFDDAPVPMLITDATNPPEQRIVKVNRALVGLLGYSEAELLGQGATHTEPNPIVAQLTAGLVDDSANQRIKRYAHRDGQVLWCSVFSAALFGSLRLAHIVDISDQVFAEEERVHREEFLVALSEVRSETLRELPRDEVLISICRRTVNLFNASQARIALVTGPNELRIVASAPESEHEADSGATPELDANVLARDDEIVRRTFEQGGAEGMLNNRDVVALPIETVSGQEGILFVHGLVVNRREAAATSRMLSTLAAEAGAAIGLMRARDDRRRALVGEDRERIARDLHDLVIQRLFATGMQLQAAVSSPTILPERVHQTVDELDRTIAVIRDTIFQLTSSGHQVASDVSELIDGYRNRRENEGVRINFSFNGDFGDIPLAVVEQVIPTMNEALSNVTRHASASRVDVRLAVGDELTLEVSDDGSGMPDEVVSGLGLHNMSQRAKSLGGSMTVGPSEHFGTSLVWTVPL